MLVLFSGGNVSTLEQLVSGYFTGDNVSVIQQEIIGWFTGGNVTPSDLQQLLSGWFSGGNISSNNQLFSGFFTGGNISINSQLISGWVSGGNTSTNIQLLSGWFTGGNITLVLQQLLSGWFTGGNVTVTNQIISGYFTGGNITFIPIIISNEYPSNNSFNAPLQPIIYVTINSTGGETMNISWYYGLSEGAENILLGSDNNIGNSTQNEMFITASSRSTMYYWRVQADDGTTYVNETFNFRTEGYPGGGGMVGNYQIPLSVGASALLFAFYVLIRRRKRRQMYA